MILNFYYGYLRFFVVKSGGLFLLYTKKLGWETHPNIYYRTEDDVFAIWKVIYQQTVYQVKRSSDGKWKFYKYDKAIDFYKDPEVYSADYYYY